MTRLPCLLALFLALLPLPSHAMMGNEGAHGGDPYALEFKTIGTELGKRLTQLQAADPSLFAKWKFTPDRFAKTVSFVRVVTAEGDEVVLRGHEVDAINTPADNLIQVNRTRWREDDLHARAQLVLHEIFGILGVERDTFDASYDFADFVTQASKSIESSRPSGSFLTSLFYGRCVSFPNLDDAGTCESDSEKLLKAESCARTQAEEKCRVAGRSSCQVMSTSFEPKMSRTQLGLRYCEVLVILK